MISRGSIPFNMAFQFLSGCPEALAEYLYRNIPEIENMDVDHKSTSDEEQVDVGGPSEGTSLTHSVRQPRRLVRLLVLRLSVSSTSLLQLHLHMVLTR